MKFTKAFYLTGTLAALLALLSSTSAQAGKSRPVWVTAYYASWRDIPKPEEVDFSVITHLIYFTIFPTATGDLDPKNQGVKDATADALATAAHKAGKKVIICIGGDGAGPAFRSAIAAEHRDVFVKNIVDWVASHHFDGVDIDFEPMETADGPDFQAFSKDLRAALDKAQSPSPFQGEGRGEVAGRLLVTAAVEGRGFPAMWAPVQDDYDQINLMTYDMSGRWSTETWFNSGLSNGGRKEKATGQPLPSCEQYVEKWEAGGVNAEKLGIGVCFSGRIFHGADGPDQPMEGVKIRGTNYARVMDIYADSLYRWDAAAKSPYLSISSPDKTKSMFVVYDDSRECAEKVKYARGANLGGLIIWELSGDYLRNAPAGADRVPLITAIGKALRQ